MAIKMVRQPSETPNINNIDDIIPFRYAYGNQSGYVIGKGSELAGIINGNQFTISSGRVVLQGVESDVDANGVTLTIDNINETRYYSIYYKVNLATNTASIESTFDTAGYPTLNESDDLTVNSSGTAYLELFRFTAYNGVISGVQKVVSSIKYTKDVVVDNSTNSVNAQYGSLLKPKEIYADEIGVDSVEIPSSQLSDLILVKAKAMRKQGTSGTLDFYNYTFNVLLSKETMTPCYFRDGDIIAYTHLKRATSDGKDKISSTTIYSEDTTYKLYITNIYNIALLG